MMPGIAQSTQAAGNGLSRLSSSPAGERTDEQLLEGYRHGERPAFALLVGRYQRELFHFLVRFLGSRSAAEDVFQETFLQVHQSAEQLIHSEDFARGCSPSPPTRRAI